MIDGEVMHKYLVVSDNHGRDDNFLKILDLEENLSGIIHCGDFEGTEGKFAIAADCPVYFVSLCGLKFGTVCFAFSSLFLCEWKRPFRDRGREEETRSVRE